MAQIDNIDNIAFSTEYPIDKVVGYYEDSFAIAAATTSPPIDVVARANDANIHGLGYRPKVDGVWSIDGTNYYPFGVPIITNIGTTSTASDFDALIAVGTTTSTQAIVRGYSYDQTARTIYYKMWLIYPEK